MVGAAFSIMLLKDAYIAKKLKNTAEAYYLAEAGVEEAIADLWDNSFNISHFPKSRTLGNGSVATTLNTSKWASNNILLITSTGTARGTTRTLKAEVKANISPSFNYVILANGKILVTQKGVVNCSLSEGVHSNSSAQGGLFTTSAVDVFGILRPCYVYGDASAVGRVRERLQGDITGAKVSGDAAVSLPTFDATFFDYYITQANLSGDVYNPPSGTQRFTTNLSPGNGVIYVNGNVSLEGNITVNGCIVATGNIWVNFLTRGRVIQNQVGNLPALMSRTGGIWVWDPTTLNGLVYAASDITFFSLLGQVGDVYVNGTIMSKGAVSVADEATINYVKQNPPGLGANPIGWILSWNE
jgi:hypothetical protein